MEQKKNIMTFVKNDKKDGSGGEISDEDENGRMGIHSQVMKIKKEFEKVKHPSLQLQPEMRRVLQYGINRQRRSRSPLGLPSQRPLSVAVERNSCRV